MAEQPAPVPNDGPAIVDLVVEDLAERKRLGIARYGTPLQAHNGRDALLDAYQEALDLAIYLRQVIEEREADDLTEVEIRDLYTLSMALEQENARLNAECNRLNAECNRLNAECNRLNAECNAPTSAVGGQP